MNRLSWFELRERAALGRLSENASERETAWSDYATHALLPWGIGAVLMGLVGYAYVYRGLKMPWSAKEVGPYFMAVFPGYLWVGLFIALALGPAVFRLFRAREQAAVTRARADLLVHTLDALRPGLDPMAQLRFETRPNGWQLALPWHSETLLLTASDIGSFQVELTLTSGFSTSSLRRAEHLGLMPVAPGHLRYTSPPHTWSQRLRAASPWGLAGSDPVRAFAQRLGAWLGPQHATTSPPPERAASVSLQAGTGLAEVASPHPFSLALPAPFRRRSTPIALGRDTARRAIYAIPTGLAFVATWSLTAIGLTPYAPHWLLLSALPGALTVVAYARFLTHHPAPVYARLQSTGTHLVLEGALLGIEHDGLWVDPIALDAPFDMAWTRARGWLTLELRQEGRRLAMRVPALQGCPTLSELESYDACAVTLTAEQLCQHLWPALAFFANAHGRVLSKAPHTTPAPVAERAAQRVPTMASAT